MATCGFWVTGAERCRVSDCFFTSFTEGFVGGVGLDTPTADEFEGLGPPTAVEGLVGLSLFR